MATTATKTSTQKSAARAATLATAASTGSTLKESLLVRLSNDDLLKHCIGMLEDIIEKTKTDTITTASTTTGIKRTRLIDKTSKLFDILSDEQQRKHRNRILSDSGSNNGVHSDINKTISNNYNENEKNNRKKTRDDDEGVTALPLHDDTNVPTSVIVNHLLPFLDHNTWKSVSIISKDIYETVHRQKLYPPWPTDIINMKEDARGSFSFDHDKGNRLVMTKNESGSIFDSRRGFIKKIDFSMVIKMKEARSVCGIYLIDATTFILELEMEDVDNFYLYLYRMVEEIPFHRKIVGVDIIPFPHEKVKRGRWSPWFFKRNGSTYIATTQKSTTNNSDKIVVNQYLGQHSWPNCLHQTHCLVYPKIEMSANEEMFSEVFQYLPFPSHSKKEDIIDEKIVLVSATDYDNRYVHCWRLDFDPQIITSNGTTMNNNTNNNLISPILCENIPRYEAIGNKHAYSELKITTLPYGSNDSSFRIIEFWPLWWKYYVDNKEDFDANRDYEEYTYPNMIEEHNKANIIIWDYNINLNKFEVTNKFPLTKWDGTPLQYEELHASNDGQYLLSFSESDGLSVCRPNNLDTGSKKVQTYKNFKHRVNFIGSMNNEGGICLSNDNKFAFPYKNYRSTIRINYLYLNSS